MNNNLHIDEVLDALLKEEIARTEAETILQKENVSDTATEIDLHVAAAKSLQRYTVLKQVQSVHTAYINGGVTVDLPKNREDLKPRVLKMQPVKWMLRIAASIILLLGGWFAYEYNTTSSNRLYNEIYQPYNINTDRGVKDIKTHNMVQLFKDNDYIAVIQIYESLGTTNNREKFLAAYAYHETENYQQAVTVLQQILLYNKQSNTRFYNDEAEFYLGLSYLKMKDVKSAAPLFKAIRNNPNHTFHERVSDRTIRRLTWLK